MNADGEAGRASGDWRNKRRSYRIFWPVSAVALLCSIFHVVSLPFQLDMAWWPSSCAVLIILGGNHRPGDGV